MKSLYSINTNFCLIFFLKKGTIYRNVDALFLCNINFSQLTGEYAPWKLSN